MARVGEVTVFFGANTKQFTAALQGIGTRMSSLGQKATALGGSLTTKLTLPLSLIGGVAIKSFADFDFQMRRVAAVSSATGEQFKQLTALARKMGRTTQFTAKQSAEAMTFLSVAGFKTVETMGALPGVLQLAAAGAVDLGTAADIAAKILKGYNFEVTELGRVNDVLTKTFISSNTMLGELGEGFKVLAPIARTAGLEFEEMAAALGLLADNAFQGGLAGTGLRRVISGLLKPSKEAEKIFNKMGLRVIAASGKMRKMSSILRDLKVGLNRMGGQAEQAGLLMELFGLRGGPVMAALLKEGGDRLDEFAEKLRNSGGIAAEIATKQMAGLKGALLELTSALQDSGLAIGKTLEPSVRGIGGAIRDLAISFSESSQAFKNLTVGMGVFAAFAGPALLLFGGFVAAGRSLIPVLAKILPFIGGATGGALVVGTLAWVSALGSLRKDFDTIFDGLPAVFDIPLGLLKKVLDRVDEFKTRLAGAFELLSGGRRQKEQAKNLELFKRQQELVLVFAERVKALGLAKGLTLFGSPKQILALGKGIPTILPMLQELVNINRQLGTTSSELAKKFEVQSEALKRVAGGFVDVRAAQSGPGVTPFFTNIETTIKGTEASFRAIEEGGATILTNMQGLGQTFIQVETDSRILLTNIEDSADKFTDFSRTGGFVVEKLIDVGELLKEHEDQIEKTNVKMLSTGELINRLSTGSGTWRDRLGEAASKAANITAQLLAAEQVIDRINAKGGAKFTGG